MSRLRANAWVVMFVGAAGCYSSAGGPDADGGREDGGGGGEACDRPTCFSDFPCGSDSFCRDRTTIQRCRSIPCWETCGTTCCSGASCGASSTEACPAGTECAERPHAGFGSWGGTEAVCLPAAEPDAGPSVDAGGDVDGGDDDGGDEDGDAWAFPAEFVSYCR
jgi:hypothetical protein